MIRHRDRQSTLLFDATFRLRFIYTTARQVAHAVGVSSRMHTKPNEEDP
jgi:hypothetical protein